MAYISGHMYSIGLDIGSSSVKAALVDNKTGKAVLTVQHPDSELDIISHYPGWAEQDPEIWWDCVCFATKKLMIETSVKPKDIKSIGITYQMHGLVLVDKKYQVLRPSIIWCDSRSVEIGKAAFEKMGKEHCLHHYLNSPGNFTASKLKWVMDNEPAIYEQIYKVMLPGDYIAMKLTGEIKTTISGLSEGILWDFKNHTIAKDLLDCYKISSELIPNIVDTFGQQGEVQKSAAKAMGLKIGTPVTYRAGDQSNNALSLGVFNVNEIAATGGTSGVVYGISDEYIYDRNSRLNSFAHVNHQKDRCRVGILLCINGAGIQYAWMKQQIARDGITYEDMEQIISEISVGSDGLRILPFGNGAERMLDNKSTGAQINNLQFNRHNRNHFYRAALEGIAFSFVYGFNILKEMNIVPKVIKVGNDNLFQSTVFSSTIANLIACPIQLIETTGAIGAAKASGIGIGAYDKLEEAFSNNTVQKVFSPNRKNGKYEDAYQLWKSDLEKLISDT